MKKIKYFIFSLLIMFIGIFDVYGFSDFSDTQKNALKKVLDISESYGIFVNVYFDIKTILFKNNMKSK